MKLLLLGKNGQIGWELQRTLAPLGEVIALGRHELDLANQQAIRSIVRSVKPDLIVNAAAYTTVDRAEQEPDLAMAVNGIAPGILAEEAALLKTALIHYSTDYVFDGTHKTPYEEIDQPNPINIYGRTKLAGEQAIIKRGCRHLILRTSWVYGLRGSNFLLKIISLAQEREELSIVDDQFGAPTWCRLIAEATAQIIARDPYLISNKEGLYHLAATGETTWYHFVCQILKQLQKDLLKTPGLKAIKTKELPALATRPQYSVLNSSKLFDKYGIRLPEWDQQLKLALSTGNKDIFR